MGINQMVEMQEDEEMNGRMEEIQKEEETVKIDNDQLKCETNTSGVVKIKFNHSHIQNNREFKCPKCFRTFNWKQNLERHIQICTNEEESKHKVFKRARKCLKCDFVVQGLSNIRRHMNENHPDILNAEKGLQKLTKIIYLCNHCEYVGFHMCRMKTHYQTNHCSEVHSCHLCDFVTNSSEYLRKHIKMHVPESHKKCDKCKKQFIKEDFYDHVCEAKTFVCNDCGEIYHSKDAFKYHQKMKHSNLKKDHICNICGKGFYMKGHLTSHMSRAHLNKPVTCPECGLQVKNLKMHLKIIHTPDEEKKFQCEDCGKGFAKRDSYTAHRMNMHLKLRPYRCRYGCDMSYNDTSNRNQHEKRVHGQLYTVVKPKMSETHD